MTGLLCVISFEADFESFGHLDKISVYVNAYYSRIILCLCLRISKFCQVEYSVSLSFYDIFFLFFCFCLFWKRILQSIFQRFILHVLINSDFNRKLGGSLYKLGREVWTICLSWTDILSIVITNRFISPYFAKTKDKNL